MSEPYISHVNNRTLQQGLSGRSFAEEIATFGPYFHPEDFHHEPPFFYAAFRSLATSSKCEYCSRRIIDPEKATCEGCGAPLL